MTLEDLAEAVMAQAKQCDVTLVTAESCTAGAVAHLLSKVEGAGEHFHGGFVTYTKAMKTRVLGIEPRLLRDLGAVSAEVAEAMAAGALNASPADVAVAITGVIGPDPDEDGNPVGLVYIAGQRRGGPRRPATRMMFDSGTPEEILEECVRQTLLLLRTLCEDAARVSLGTVVGTAC
jgi:nicotinamide-nucleotide amidase